VGGGWVGVWGLCFLFLGCFGVVGVWGGGFGGGCVWGGCCVLGGVCFFGVCCVGFFFFFLCVWVWCVVGCCWVLGGLCLWWGFVGFVVGVVFWCCFFCWLCVCVWWVWGVTAKEATISSFHQALLGTVPHPNALADSHLIASDQAGVHHHLHLTSTAAGQRLSMTFDTCVQDPLQNGGRRSADYAPPTRTACESAAAQPADDRFSAADALTASVQRLRPTPRT